MKQAGQERRQLSLLGIAGSLRSGSWNRALLETARGLGGERWSLEIASLDAVPLYNADVEAQGVPEGVSRLRRAIAEADGVLIATPEYNHSVPGVLKNAIDWLSRPPKPQPFDGRPVGVLGATPGAFGTRGAQYHLRQSLTALNALMMAQPQMLVRGAGELFDDQLRLVDAATSERLERFLRAFAKWVRRVG